MVMLQQNRMIKYFLFSFLLKANYTSQIRANTPSLVHDDIKFHSAMINN